jgi:glutaconyl-CoA/methylmalonyl-CoA decarboxylase subunit gamma
MEKEIKIGEKNYKIEVSEADSGTIKVKINGEVYFFAKNKFNELISVDPQTKSLASDIEDCAVAPIGLTGKEIKSPLAGVISTVEVSKGDKVRPGKKVATLIAMKMENEIVAGTAGVVKDIRIKPGQFVNNGEILIIFE